MSDVAGHGEKPEVPEPPHANVLEFAGVLQDIQQRIASGSPMDFEAVAAAFPNLVDRLLPLFAKAETLCFSPTDRQAAENSPPVPVVAQSQTGSLGDFQLLREIGRGGMGMVYEANQISLNRRVAVKIFPFAGICAPHQLQRFQIEARAAASLHHTHIVPVFTVGCDRGVYYYAMQFIEGRSLACLLNDLRLAAERRSEGDSTPPLEAEPSTGTQSFGETRVDTSQSPFPSMRQIAEWGAELADALHYAHSLGIVHRDVKPGNLLLDKSGRVWITDFGIAQMASSENLTLTGDVLGSLPYASPEQTAGDRARVDHRSDIYGLGATLYELLTRHPVFKSKDRAEAIRQVIAGEPIEIRKVNPQVPKELATIVHKAIERDLSGRYQSAREMAEDLRRFLQDRPISAKPATAVDRLRKWARRNPVFVRSASLFVSLSLLIIAVSAFLIDRERQQTLVERQAHELDRQAHESARLSHESERRMAQAARKSMEINRYVNLVNHAERAFNAGKISESRAILRKCLPETDGEDLRSFDWHYLWSATDDASRPPFGRHQGMAYSLHLSPDKSLLASAGQDGVRIWQASSGELLEHLTDHRGDVNDARFSSAGDRLATSGDDGVVRIWNTKDWGVEAELAHEGAVVAARFVPGRNLLVTAERDFEREPGKVMGKNIVRLWETNAWSCLSTMQEHSDDIHALDISTDGALVATASSDQTVAIWNLNANTLKETLNLPALVGMKSFGAQCVKFSQFEPLLAMAGSDGTLRFLNIEDYAVTLAPWIARTGLQFVCYSPDERQIVTGGDVAKITALAKTSDDEFSEESSQAFWPAHHQWAAEFLDNHRFWTAGRDGAIQFWDTQHAYGARRSPVPKMSRGGAAFTRDSQHLLVPEAGVRVLRVSDGACVRRLAGTEPMACVATSPDGRIAAAASVSGIVTTWNLQDGRLVDSLRSGIEFPDQLVFALNGRAIYVRNTHLRRFKMLSDRLTPIDPPGPEFRSHGTPWFDSAAKTAAVAEQPTVIQIWRESLRIKEHSLGNQEILMATLNHDGSRIAVSLKNGTIQIYETKGMALISEIVAGDPQTHLVFSPDGRVLVGVDTIATIRSIQIWNSASGHQLLKLRTDCSSMHDLRFSPDGTILGATGASLTGEGEVLLWSGLGSEG